MFPNIISGELFVKHFKGFFGNTMSCSYNNIRVTSKHFFRIYSKKILCSIVEYICTSGKLNTGAT